MRARTITAALGITLATLGAGCATSTTSATDCATRAATIAATHDYRPSDRACFGEEDDPRVAALLNGRGLR